MAIRQAKARSFEQALWWAERGIAVYGSDAARPDAVDDLKKRVDATGRSSNQSLGRPVRGSHHPSSLKSRRCIAPTAGEPTSGPGFQAESHSTAPSAAPNKLASQVPRSLLQRASRIYRRRSSCPRGDHVIRIFAFRSSAAAFATTGDSPCSSAVHSNNRLGVAAEATGIRRSTPALRPESVEGHRRL